MDDEFADCMVGNSRMAARAITRRYDAYLRPYGLTATQFSLLGVVGLMPGASVSELAEARGFERTTLTRNLDRLEAMGLIAAVASHAGNARVSAPTTKGRAIIDKLLPKWRKAQAEIRAELSFEGFETSLNVLRRLAKV